MNVVITDCIFLARETKSALQYLLCRWKVCGMKLPEQDSLSTRWNLSFLIIDMTRTTISSKVSTLEQRVYTLNHVDISLGQTYTILTSVISFLSYTL